jgi:hypothetical protein
MAQLGVVASGAGNLTPLPVPQSGPCARPDSMSLANAAAAVSRLQQSVNQQQRIAAALLAMPSLQGGPQAVASCLGANLPAGDALNLVGINFIVRSGEHPCISVQAGTVNMKQARIDSRGTRWAFDVKESGRLVLEDSSIETDGGGVHARRSVVEMRRVAIQLERGRRGIGASLTGADGMISDLNITGGEVGLVVSSGSRGMLVERPVVSDAGVGIELVGHPGQGTISVRGATIHRSIVGVWIRNNASVWVSSSMTQARSCAALATSRARISHSPSQARSGRHRPRHPVRRFPTFAARLAPTPMMDTAARHKAPHATISAT